MMSPSSRAAHLFILILLAYLFIFSGLGIYSLKDPDEGRYAEIPREMVESGDYLVPRLNYVRYFEKPPLYYWFAAASYKLFGVREWPFRFPNALAALLCAVILYVWTRRRFEEDVAFRAALILITSLGFLFMARIVTLDMTFTLFLMMALLAFHGFYHEGRKVRLYAFWGSAALATLLKGPVALVLLGLTILLFLLLEKRIRFLKRLFWSPAFLLYFAIAAPWFIAISCKEPDFARFFFIDQHLLRYLTSKHDRMGPLYYFLPVLVLGMLPWSLLLPQAFVRAVHDSRLRLFLVWIAVVFLFFSFSGSKLPPYILPLLPALALVIGNYLNPRETDTVKQSLILRMIYAALFFLIAGVLFGLSAGLLDEYLSRSIGNLGISPRQLRFTAIVPGAVCLVLGVGVLLRRWNVKVAITGANTILVASLVLLFLLNLNLVDRIRTTKGLASVIAAAQPVPDYVVDFNSFHESLSFYMGQRVLMAAYKGELEMGSSYPDARDYFISLDDFVRLFSSPSTVIAVVKKTKLDRFKNISPVPVKILTCQDDDCLISNH